MSHQQTARQRQQRQGLSREEQEGLKAQLSTTYSDDILVIARHFGKQPSADAARVLDIDFNGFTIEWDWKESDDAKVRKEEMQFAFREVRGPGSALQEISELAAEAHQALGVRGKPKLAEAIEAMEARNMVDFTFAMPNVLSMVFCIVGLGLLGYLALAENIHPSLVFLTQYVSQTACYYIFGVAIGLHVLEAAIAYMLCHLIKTFQPRQMNTENQVKWTLGCALFGVFCLHGFVTRLRLQFAMADAISAHQQQHQQQQSSGARDNKKNL
ncbi:hypothetical protein GGI12_002824 [Dipsacomyces acuminosporus]|nr:hypothetical protein GGI12_002824 [Dipsacomyces acuminosporus]